MKRKSKHKNTLIHKFALIVCISIFISVLFMSSYNIYTSSVLIKQNQQDRATSYKYLTSLIINGFKRDKEANNFDNVSKITNNLTNSGLVLYVNIIDLNKNKYIWSSISGLQGTNANLNDPWSSKVFAEKFNSVQKENIRQEFSIVGNSMLVTGFFENNSLITVLLKGNLTLAFIFIFFGFASAFILANFVTKPIKELAVGAEEFAKGNLKYRTPINTPDELGTLASSFNLMAEKLDVLYSSLEQQVKDRTKELSSKSEQLEKAYNELQETQAMMIHNEKMTSLGQLVAGVAHELNNPINFINGNLTHLKNYVNDLTDIIEEYNSVKSDLSPENLEKIDQLIQEIDYEFIKEDLGSLLKSCKEGTERAKQIVMDLKNFSRLDEAQLKEVDVHEGIDSTLNILHNKYKDKVTIHKEYGDIPKLNCLAGQLNQVFMNILDNSSQAVKDKGDVYIRTKFENNDIIIEIEDNGVGIDKDVLPKIFDPFFTTKAVGEGTGLGLSISYKIIKKHNGIIEAESEKGKGTKFTIKIPLDWTKDSKELEKADIS